MMKTLNDIVNMALQNEEEGARFYRETAAQSKNPLVQATFEFLAKEEDLHVKIFRDYICDQHLADPHMLAYPHINPKDEIRKLFDQKSKKQIQDVALKNSDKTDAYEVGLKIEQKSYDLYRSHIEEISGEREKEFLQFLCKQENAHYQILQESKAFLESPGDWFQKEERWMQI